MEIMQQACDLKSLRPSGVQIFLACFTREFLERSDQNLKYVSSQNSCFHGNHVNEDDDATENCDYDKNDVDDDVRTTMMVIMTTIAVQRLQE